MHTYYSNIIHLLAHCHDPVLVHGIMECSEVPCVECSGVQWSGVENGVVVFYSAEECSEVHHNAVEGSEVKQSVVCCGVHPLRRSTAREVAAKCSGVQYSAVQWNAVDFSAVQWSTMKWCTVQCSECSAVKCTAANFETHSIPTSIFLKRKYFCTVV